ncbi:MAG: exodeoxyribonuclease V subunit alpha, partial [Balneolaceae bacterium]
MQTDLQFDPETGNSDKRDEPLSRIYGLFESELIRFLEFRHGVLQDRVKFAVAFLSLFRKAGHVCLPLDLSCSEWCHLLEIDPNTIQDLPARIHPEDLMQSGITGRPGEVKPFILDEENRLFTHKTYFHETDAARTLKKLSASIVQPEITPPIKNLINTLYPDSQNSREPDYQKAAAILSLYKKLIVLSGGPGTGKTTTITKILALHAKLNGPGFSIALAAPTGKAAARMSEAITRTISVFNPDAEQRVSIPKKAMTLHRLLQPYNSTGLFPDMKDPLPYDLIVIDEASMMDLVMAQKLLKNIGENTMLVLVGDRNQLASVEAGAVLGDLCIKKGNGLTPRLLKIIQNDFPDFGIPAKPDQDSAMDDSVIYLEKNFRFGSESGIGVFADTIKRGDGDGTVKILDDQVYEDVQYGYLLTSAKDYESVFESLFQVFEMAAAESPEEALTHWQKSIWLTPHRYKYPGVVHLNREFEKYMAGKKRYPVRDNLFDGKPVLITKNDYHLNLFNGDHGVIKTTNGVKQACFMTAENAIRMVGVSRLTHYEPAWFWTVHKCQGSEFDKVHLLLPEGDSPVLSKELIYTAVTRARKQFLFHGDTNT